jgi:hypothetical protein
MVINHSRLYGNSLIRYIHIENSGHAGKAEDNSCGVRQRSAGEPGTRTAGNEWNLMLRTDSYDRLNLRCRTRKHNGSRDRAQGRKAIAFVRLELVALHDDAIRSDGGL